MSLSIVCEAIGCNKEATHMCSSCKTAAYCSQEHQVENWKIHREHCPVLNSYRLRGEEEELNKKRNELRKKYFESFMYKVYDSCIKTSEDLVELERTHIKTTREIFNELEYGIAQCLLARSWLNVKNEAKAIIILQSYLEEKEHFLKDMRDVSNFEVMMKKEQYRAKARKESEKEDQNIGIDYVGGSIEPTEEVIIEGNLKEVHAILKEFSIKKVSLLATVGNILYCVKEKVIPIYEIYTKHIEKMFGRESYELSNCYFMVGSYYMEINEFYKSIACFMRAAEMRNIMAGDCYYNLGILYQLLGRSRIALMMFDNSAKLREMQYSESSFEVADVYHNIALIYQRLGNYKDAIANFEKIALIYSKDKNCEEFKNTKDSIKALEEEFKKHLDKFLDAGDPRIKEYKGKLRKREKPDESLAEGQPLPIVEEEPIVKRQKDGYLKLSEEFISRLNAKETKYLAELQEELHVCETFFMAATKVGQSNFFISLNKMKEKALIELNPILFNHIKYEELSRKDQNNQLAD